MLNIVCYKPDLQHVAGIIALSKRGDLRISVILLDDLKSEAASLCELAGLSLLKPQSDIPIDSMTTILAPDELISSDRFLHDNFAKSTIVGYQDFIESKHKPPQVAARVEKPIQVNVSEMSSVYTTLTRIEETLDREKLMPWLLALGVKAMRGCGGSLMLLDNQTQEL